MDIKNKETYDLVAHIQRQIEFSKKTFGPDTRLNGVLEHIGQEIEEIRKEPKDIYEWIDLMLLAIDGCWRQGFTPEEIAFALEAKLSKNEKRSWPDWRTLSSDKAINHIKK